MIVETRTTDVLTGAADLEALASYRLPVFAGCTDQDAQLDQIETIDFDTALEILYDFQMDHYSDFSESELLAEADMFGIDIDQFKIEE